MCLIALFFSSSPPFCTLSLLFLFHLHGRIYLMQPEHSMSHYWFLFPLLSCWVFDAGVQWHAGLCCGPLILFNVLSPSILSIHHKNVLLFSLSGCPMNTICTGSSLEPHSSGMTFHWSSRTLTAVFYKVRKISQWFILEPLRNPCILNSLKIQT